MSLQRGTVIPIRADGQPLNDFIVWMDKRGIPHVNWMEKEIGNQHYYDISGHPITYITGVSKLLAIQKDHEELWNQTEVIGPPETLFLRWLGCDDFVCSESTGTYLFPFDIKQKHFSPRLLEELGFPEKKLPRIVSALQIVGRLSAAAAKDLGLSPGIPLIPGGGDGQCAALGCGVISPGLCMINIGTGAGIQTYLEKPLSDPRCVLNCAAHVDPIAWEMEGHTQASGAVFRWLRDEFGALELALEGKSRLDAFDLLIDQAITAPAGSEGLICLPTFNGSTAPIIDQEMRGAFLGLRLSHTRGHVFRALLEGISMEIRWMLDAIRETGASINQVRLVGGGSRNPHWNQIHADILGCPVHVLQIPDAALVGAAMCAAVAVGEYESLQEAAKYFVKIKNVVEPDKGNLSVYNGAYENYKRSFKLLSENNLFQSLNN